MKLPAKYRRRRSSARLCTYDFLNETNRDHLEHIMSAVETHLESLMIDVFSDPQNTDGVAFETLRGAYGTTEVAIGLTAFGVSLTPTNNIPEPHWGIIPWVKLMPYINRDIEEMVMSISLNLEEAVKRPTPVRIDGISEREKMSIHLGFAPHRLHSPSVPYCARIVIPINSMFEEANALGDL